MHISWDIFDVWNTLFILNSHNLIIIIILIMHTESENIYHYTASTLRYIHTVNSGAIRTKTLFPNRFWLFFFPFNGKCWYIGNCMSRHMQARRAWPVQWFMVLQMGVQKDMRISKSGVGIPTDSKQSFLCRCNWGQQNVNRHCRLRFIRSIVFALW